MATLRECSNPGSMTTYDWLVQLLDGKDERTICNNTVATHVRNPAAARSYVNVYLHGNLIVSAYSDGISYLSDAGWATYVTKQRLNMLTSNNVAVWQHKYQWYFSDHRLPSGSWVSYDWDYHGDRGQTHPGYSCNIVDETELLLDRSNSSVDEYVQQLEDEVYQQEMDYSDGAR